MKVYEVIPGRLYMRQEFHKLKTKEAALKELGVDTVVCLLQRGDPDMPAMVEYIHRPLPDGMSIDVAYVRSIVDEVDDRLSQGKKVLVHCIAGKNRSGLICALTAMRHYTISGADAVSYIRWARPGALTNNYFVAFLNKLVNYDRYDPHSMRSLPAFNQLGN